MAPLPDRQSTQIISSPLLSIVGFFSVRAASGTDMGAGENDGDAIDKADELYTNYDISHLYEFLKGHENSSNVEILWRLARACSEMAKLSKEKSRAKFYMKEGLDIITKAMKIDDTNFRVHTWYAALLHYVGEYEGIKKIIVNSYAVREHFQKAIDLNPRDAISLHSLGYWCYAISDIPWYQRKAASLLFATPPTSTYDEALSFLLRAEEVAPDSFSPNHLLLGKTYIRLKQPENAVKHLLKARDNTGPTPDDKNARDESKRLLAELGKN